MRREGDKGEGKRGVGELRIGRVKGESSAAVALSRESLTNTHRCANNWVRSKSSFLVGPQEPLLATLKKRKLACFGRVTHYDRLSKSILQGILKG